MGLQRTDEFRQDGRLRIPLTAPLVSLAQNAKSPPKGGLNHDALVSSTKVVAGAHNPRCRKSTAKKLII
jgi:hypothetical protein